MSFSCIFETENLDLPRAHYSHPRLAELGQCQSALRSSLLRRTYPRLAAQAPTTPCAGMRLTAVTSWSARRWWLLRVRDMRTWWAGWSKKERTSTWSAAAAENPPSIGQQGKLVCQWSSEKCPWQRAIHFRRRHIEAAQLILDCEKFDVESHENSDDNTALVEAINNDHSEMAELLLSNPGTNVNARSSLPDGYPALHLAIAKNNLKVTRLLLSRDGLACNVVNPRGKSSPR